MILTDTGATRNLVLSTGLTLTIIVIAWFLSSMESSPLIPATTLIAADYQMESAIIMQMQQLSSNSQRQPQPMNKEIMPGIIMRLDSTESDDKTWVFKASVTGQGINRKMQARAHSSNPDKIMFFR
ncbi:MAG: hypothetical protein PHD82_00655 [Candidatus Riflebacteria bacterium]|jgi:hypothetical protein|nr:hypothetical protein [Candidatus Riflebacteria bacterium]